MEPKPVQRPHPPLILGGAERPPRTGSLDEVRKDIDAETALDALAP